MKKILSLIVIIVLSIGMCVSISANSAPIETLSISNTEIIFSENSSLSDEQRTNIAEYLVYGDNGAQTYGLMCNLFGHKNTEEIVTTITHGERITRPKCLKQQWELNVCSRCDNVEETLLTSYYIDCCE